MKREVINSLIDELKEREFELPQMAEIFNKICAYEAATQAVNQNAENKKRLEQWSRIAAISRNELEAVLENYNLEHFLDEIF